MEARIVTVKVHMPKVVEPLDEPRIKRLDKDLDKALVTMSYVIVGSASGIFIAALAIPAAAAERGYYGAIGGEWLLIPAVIYVACWIHSKVLRWGAKK